MKFLKDNCYLDFHNIDSNSEYFLDSPAAKLLFPEKI